MVQADADVMLIDEVLAVGDAAFAQKCMDVFREKRRARQDDRARHARHDDGADALPPGDAAPRRGAALHRRAGGCGAALLPDELRGGRDRREPAPGAPGVVDVNARVVGARAARTRRRARSRRRARASRSSSTSCWRRRAAARARTSSSTSATTTARPSSSFDAPARRGGRSAGGADHARRPGREPPRSPGATRSTSTSREDGEQGERDRAGPAAAALRRSHGRRDGAGRRRGRRRLEPSEAVRERRHGRAARRARARRRSAAAGGARSSCST